VPANHTVGPQKKAPVAQRMTGGPRTTS
jgi:hypothetical protein